MIKYDDILIITEENRLRKKKKKRGSRFSHILNNHLRNGIAVKGIPIEHKYRVDTVASFKLDI